MMNVPDVDKAAPILESPDRRYPRINYRVLGPFSVAAITYLYGCAGPVGSENIIAAAGPTIGTLSIVVYPLLVTIPYAYIIAELCCSFPDDGGFSVWVLNSFGPFWGFQVGFWAWCAGVINCAIFPQMVLGSFSRHFGMPVLTGFTAFAAKSGLLTLFALPALGRSLLVGRISITALAIVLIPVLVLTVLCYVHFDSFSKLSASYHSSSASETVRPEVNVDWATLLNTIIWNYDGINVASVFGGEVQNPARTYPRAITIIVILTIATFLLPIPALLTTEKIEWYMFGAKTYSLLALEVGGKTVRYLMVTSGITASAAQCMTAVFIQSFQLSGLSENQLLPSILSKRNAMFGSPHFAMFATYVASLCLVSFETNVLLPATNILACAVEFVIFLTAIQLRRKLPYVPRPIKVPGGIPMLCCMAVMPVSVLSYITFSAIENNHASAMIVGSLIVPGLVFGGYQHLRHKAMF